MSIAFESVLDLYTRGVLYLYKSGFPIDQDRPILFLNKVPSHLIKERFALMDDHSTNPSFWVLVTDKDYGPEFDDSLRELGISLCFVQDIIVSAKVLMAQPLFRPKFIVF